jgi:hypothetical protein
LREHHRFARGQVRGNHGKRNAKVFKLTRIENAFDQIFKPLIAGQAEAGDAPAGDIPKTEGTASLNDAGKRRATGVGCAKDTANAGSGYMRDRDLILFEHLQNAEMREAARESPAESETNPCPVGHGGCTIVQGLTRSVPVPRHARRIAEGASSTYGSGVLKEQYFCTAMETAQISVRTAHISMSGCSTVLYY